VFVTLRLIRVGDGGFGVWKWLCVGGLALGCDEKVTNRYKSDVRECIDDHQHLRFHGAPTWLIGLMLRPAQGHYQSSRRGG
jgi:hypothetical protein